MEDLSKIPEDVLKVSLTAEKTHLGPLYLPFANLKSDFAEHKVFLCKCHMNGVP